MFNFGQKLKIERVKNNLTLQELANSLNVTRQAVSQWENNNRIPSDSIVKKIEEILKIPSGYLLNNEIENFNKNLQIIGHVTAGGLEIQYQENLGYIEIPEKFSNDNKFFALKIVGDSMDKVIPDGSIAIFERNVDFVKNKIVLAEVNGKTTVKLLEYPNDNSIMLSPQSSNMIYRPVVINKNDDVQVKIIGKLVYIAKEFK